MAKLTRQAATYDHSNSTMRINLPAGTMDSYDRFDATRDTYRDVLTFGRSPLQEPLTLLLVRLFELGAIDRCTITYGTRMDLHIAELNLDGKYELASGKRLERFTAAFIEITNVPLDMVWQSSGRSGSNNGGGSINIEGLLGALGTIGSKIAEGLQIAAAVDILTSNN